MGIATVVALAVGLAMDATAVAAAKGLATPRVRAGHVAKVALWFGGFQALMPLVGYAVGAKAGGYVERWDHWIAFALLAGLGLKMLHEAWSSGGDDDAAVAGPDPFGTRVMVILAIATSIDALAAGLTLPMLGVSAAVSVATIGITTAALSAAGLLVGRRFGSALGKRLDAFGGLVLIGLGAKILFEHLTA
jgi:putative Mn2+ efflux pump MntP